MMLLAIGHIQLPDTKTSAPAKSPDGACNVAHSFEGNDDCVYKRSLQLANLHLVYRIVWRLMYRGQHN